ncbi:hypothetical protein BLNAU_9681 [Blattamonas nauphoetae]|uniref:GYF domain-containing protein n=1 Tax=Blattamonas nauphoetae TaxID=2049346 RepID=A0ABQ9XUY3_9EUKA|nr:hypothetical protein BLNAU_9681 [Blattamonas nauphoetae]
MSYPFYYSDSGYYDANDSFFFSDYPEYDHQMNRRNASFQHPRNPSWNRSRKQPPPNHQPSKQQNKQPQIRQTQLNDSVVNPKERSRNPKPKSRPIDTQRPNPKHDPKPQPKPVSNAVKPEHNHHSTNAPVLKLSSQPSVTPVTQPPPDDSKCWVYADLSGNIQGPHTSKQMGKWYKQGYLQPSLYIRHLTEELFWPLSVRFPVNQEAFVTAPVAVNEGAENKKKLGDRIGVGQEEAKQRMRSEAAKMKKEKEARKMMNRLLI